MYTIGQFSKIGQVSVKTLRYYDSIALLVPTYTDKSTNYRYYSEDQIAHLLLILELKKYDLKLEQIKAVLDSNDTRLLKTFLNEQLHEIDKNIMHNIEMKSLIQRKLNKISSGGNIMEERKEFEISLQEFNPVKVISVRQTITMDNINGLFGKAFEKAFKNGISPVGAPMTVYHDKNFNYDNADIELLLPIPQNCPYNEAGMFEPGLCAYTVFNGGYSQIGDAYANVMKWIEENNYEICGAPFDVYIKGPQQTSAPDDFITEVYFPVK